MNHSSSNSVMESLRCDEEGPHQNENVERDIPELEKYETAAEPSQADWAQVSWEL